MYELTSHLPPPPPYQTIPTKPYQTNQYLQFSVTAISIHNATLLSCHSQKIATVSHFRLVFLHFIISTQYFLSIVSRYFRICDDEMWKWRVNTISHWIYCECRTDYISIICISSLFYNVRYILMVVFEPIDWYYRKGLVLTILKFYSKT